MKRKFTKLIALLCAGVLVVQSTSSSIAAVSTGEISVSENSESNDTGDVSEKQTVSQNEEEQSVSENEEEKFEKKNIYLYTYDGYQVSYSITEEWDNAYNAEITLENTGENTIKNWKLEVDKLGDIINIWNAYLDLDDTSGYGPETTTIRVANEGIYSFKVYNYSSTPALRTSQAMVQVYMGISNEPAYTFVVPTNGDGRWWNVFQYNSITRRIIPINRIE